MPVKYTKLFTQDLPTIPFKVPKSIYHNPGTQARLLNGNGKDCLSLPPIQPETGSNIRDPIYVATRMRNTTVSVFVKYLTKIILYILCCLFSCCHLTCATAQTAQSKNIIYYSTPSFCGQKLRNAVHVPTRSRTAARLITHDRFTALPTITTLRVT